MGLVTGQLSREAAIVPIVRDQDPTLPRLHEQELGQTQEPRARVVVASYGFDRSDLGQASEEALVDDVTRHQDAGHPPQDLGQERIEAPVEVGHEPEAEVHPGLSR
jgi:hypothetical protein